MHAHGVLMVAAAGLVWLFGGLVVGVTWLARKGHLRDPDRRVPLAAYGPIFAGAFSGGAAAVHLGLVGTHAATALAASSAPIAFLCSVGAGQTHYASVDATAAGLLPLGVLSVALIPLQAAWARPSFWRRRWRSIAGVVVTLVALGVAAARSFVSPVVEDPAATLRVLSGQPIGGGTAISTIQAAAITDWLALAFELALLAIVVLLIWGRPRGLAGRTEVRLAEAWILAGLAIGGVAMFAVVSLLADHAPH
jgi:hypothetical protein